MGNTQTVDISKPSVFRVPPDGYVILDKQDSNTLTMAVGKSGVPGRLKMTRDQAKELALRLSQLYRD